MRLNNGLTMIELVEEIYSAYLDLYRDEQLASLATQTTITDIVLRLSPEDSGAAPRPLPIAA